MAESTLSVAYAELRKQVGHVLAIGRDTTVWSADEINQVDEILKAGCRQFYSPPPASPGEIAHQWSFLRPLSSIDTVVGYATGTVTIALGVVTLAGGTFPSWAAQGDLTVGGQTYTVASMASGTSLTLTDTTCTAAAGSAYSLARNAYDLPEDFGAIDGPLSFTKDSGRCWQLPVMSLGRVLALRQTNPAASTPLVAAIAPIKYATVTASPATAGQRFELHLAPAADAIYRIMFRYFVLPDALTANNIYAYGGALHSDTVLASCLAQAELRRDDMRGAYYQQFMERLASSISVDNRSTAEYLGYNGDRRSIGDDDRYGRDGRHDGLSSVSYMGVTY